MGGRERGEEDDGHGSEEGAATVAFGPSSRSAEGERWIWEGGRRGGVRGPRGQGRWPYPLGGDADDEVRRVRARGKAGRLNRGGWSVEQRDDRGEVAGPAWLGHGTVGLMEFFYLFLLLFLMFSFCLFSFYIFYFFLFSFSFLVF